MGNVFYKEGYLDFFTGTGYENPYEVGDDDYKSYERGYRDAEMDMKDFDPDEYSLARYEQEKALND